MRNGAVVAPAAITKKNIGDVVLPAGVEAAADLYLQVLDRLRQDGILRRQAGAQLSGKTREMRRSACRYPCPGRW